MEYLSESIVELQIRFILRETITYLCFFILLFMITYANRELNSFLQVHHLQKDFLNSRQIDFDYTKVSSSEKVFRFKA